MLSVLKKKHASMYEKLWVRKYLQFYAEKICLSKPMHNDVKDVALILKLTQKSVIKQVAIPFIILSS